MGEVDAFQIDVPLRGGGACLGYALDGDSLDELLVVGIHRVQAVDHVVNALLLVGRGVAQRHKRVERFEAILRSIALYGLGLVDDEYGVGLRQYVDGPAAPELVELHGDPPRVFAAGVEGLGVDDHGVDGAVGGEAVNLRELGGVVDEVAYPLAVLLGEVLLRDLEGLVHTLPDGHGGHDDDELAPPVTLVQLVHGLDVGVGLAYAGFHLHGEVVAAFQGL